MILWQNENSFSKQLSIRSSFSGIDLEAIRKEYLSAFQTPESTEAVVDGVKSLLGNILSEEQAAQFTVENVTNALSHGLTESFLNAALSLRDEVKKDTWSVCFSGNGFNAVNKKNAQIAESRTTERRYIRFIIRTRLMMQRNLQNSLCSAK